MNIIKSSILLITFGISLSASTILIDGNNLILPNDEKFKEEVVGILRTNGFSVEKEIKAEANILLDENQIKACYGCHGANFEKAALGKSKIVKDMSKDDLITALKGYKGGNYGGVMKNIMQGQVSKFTEQEIAEIANLIKNKEEK